MEPLTRGDIIVGATRNVLNPNSRTFEERQKELELIDKARTEKEKRKKQSPYTRWTQFNLENTKQLMWLGLNHPKARAILDFLVDQMDGHNAVICSHQVIQELLDINKMTVIRAISVLKDNKFIEVYKSGRSNVYCVNDTIYWKSWGDNKKYSKFSAKVILNLSEQDESYQRLLNADYQVCSVKTVTARSENGVDVEVKISDEDTAGTD